MYWEPKTPCLSQKRHGIQVPSPGENYVAHGRSLRYYEIQINDDRYRREVYLGVVDQIIQELDNHLGELSIFLVETKKHVVYDLVYMLLELILLLPVATTNVERIFSAMTLVKNKLRNSTGDDLLNRCLVTFIEREVFLKVSEDDIVQSFMGMRDRRVNRYY
jgi:hypothetical protein